MVTEEFYIISSSKIPQSDSESFIIDDPLMFKPGLLGQYSEGLFSHLKVEKKH